MKKLTGYEWLVLILTAVFILICVLHFSRQNAEVGGPVIETQRQDSSVMPVPKPDKDPDGLLDGEVIDLNRASLSDLLRLPGIGPAKAQAILDYIQEKGPLSSVDSLLDVPGIGKGTLDALRPYISAKNE